jgi:NAD(P)-dependent dehydrogenase (short-subunit alcohol dehydrogenase family)
MTTFTETDLQAFADASGDHNPLHRSESYARRTPFGQPVVFGVLGALRALAHVDPPVGQRAAKVRMSFPRALFRGVEYDVETRPDGGLVTLLGGGDRALWVTTRWTEEQSQQDEQADFAPIDAAPMRTTAAELPDLHVPVGGSYSCSPKHVRDVLGELALFNDTELAAFMWTSYVAGMELPGSQALLTEITIDFVERGDGTADGLTWRAATRKLDERFGLLTLDATLAQRGHTIAKAVIRTSVRPASKPLDVETVKLPLNAHAFAGRVAVVVGGSRGVGATIAAALALSGARVAITYRNSKDRAEQLVADLNARGCEVVAVPGDAADPDCFADVLAAVGGSIDLLVLAAWPAMQRQSQSGSGIAAGLSHIEIGLAGVATPIGELVGSMSAGAEIVLLSSQLVEEPDAGFWHYVAGKAAAESLVASHAVRHSDIAVTVVRPKAIATEYINVATATNPMPPEDAARLILEQCATGAPGLRTVSMS